MAAQGGGRTVGANLRASRRGAKVAGFAGAQGPTNLRRRASPRQQNTSAAHVVRLPKSPGIPEDLCRKFRAAVVCFSPVLAWAR